MGLRCNLFSMIKGLIKVWGTHFQENNENQMETLEWPRLLFQLKKKFSFFHLHDNFQTILNLPPYVTCRGPTNIHSVIPPDLTAIKMTHTIPVYEKQTLGLNKSTVGYRGDPGNMFNNKSGNTEFTFSNSLVISWDGGMKSFCTDPTLQGTVYQYKSLCT